MSEVAIFRKTKSSPKQYAFAVGSVVLAGIMRWLLDSWLGNTYPFGTFLVALAFVAGCLGLGPALLALVLSLLAANYFFLEPRYTFYIQGTAALIGYVIDIICGVSIVFLVYFVQRLQHEIDKLHEEERRSKKGGNS
jgi:K+-sensing histidine kinase KdpD